MDGKIDFVITWLDSTDPQWRRDYEYYSAKTGKVFDNREERWRDWNNLQYWFRGVEKFAPWVNNIYFVTCGHLPKWLNVSHPKLRIVKHSDFIPKEYLPTYNSFVIEYYFHRIEGLSEHFVYFNDDFFIINHVKPTRFFRGGLPCDIGALSYITSSGMFGSSVFLAVDAINASFKKKQAVRGHLLKWYTPLCFKMSWRNLLMEGASKFPGFVDHHLAQGYLKSIYKEVYDKHRDDFERSSKERFRSYGNMSQWIFRYWQLATGMFVPYNVFRDSKFYMVCDGNIDEVVHCVREQKKALVSINDSSLRMDYAVCKTRLIDAFESILPEKSSFEL